MSTAALAIDPTTAATANPSDVPLFLPFKDSFIRILHDRGTMPLAGPKAYQMNPRVPQGKNCSPERACGNPSWLNKDVLGHANSMIGFRRLWKQSTERIIGMNVSNVLAELRAERTENLRVGKQLEKAIKDLRKLNRIVSSGTPRSMNGRRNGRRRMSAAARRKISLAQKARWKKARKGQTASTKQV